MKSEEFLLGFYKIAKIISIFLLLNTLWIFFTFIGFVFIGIFPSTVALFTVSKKMIYNKNISIFKCFWETYKKQFIKSNFLGYSSIIVWWILYIDWSILQSSQNNIHRAISFLFFILLVIYSISQIYLIPILITYKFKFYEYLKFPLIVAIGKPTWTLITLFLLMVTIYFLQIIPFIGLFFGASIISFVTTKLTMRIFKTIRR